MKKDFINTFILKSLKLPVINDFDALTNTLGISKKMIYLLSNHSNKYYKSFEIPKKTEQQGK
ncbi:hypothetical protein [Bacillus norwichensis]|uniref:Uncharacterized protein n=1 Tax=Bacillus norwichensis TaxID=2762217 RepID=A0ABR8VKB7_9BACI|nr:hypothetical protein [Bacillus norwichensis]MBD8005215.1 hypothetical protein [Bacillus norwichensis]